MIEMQILPIAMTSAITSVLTIIAPTGMRLVRVGPTKIVCQ